MKTKGDSCFYRDTDRFHVFHQFCFVFFFAFLAAGYALAIETPLGKNGGVYTLPVRINGVMTLNFILDTGASEVSIPADVLRNII